MPISHQPIRKIKEIENELQEVTHNFKLSGYKNFGSYKISPGRIWSDILMCISSISMEAMQLLVWNKEFEWYQEYYTWEVFKDMELFVLANFFHILAGVSVSIIIKRLNYYRLYIKWRKLLYELRESQAKDTSDVLKIPNIPQTIENSPDPTIEIIKD